jgi:hypothetical protein
MTVDTGYLFTARWPILDEDRTLSQLRVEASELIDNLAADHGARITGNITWTLNGNGTELHATAPAIRRRTGAGRATNGQVSGQADLIRDLATIHHWTDRRIAERIGCSESAVAWVRRRRNIPPGVGNPTLAGAA